jgi:hypothetical protein
MSVPREQQRRGALEAVDRVLNRGGDADDILRGVLKPLGELFPYAAIRFVEGDELVLGPSIGEPEPTSSGYPVSFKGAKVAELEVAGRAEEDEPFLQRVALLISPYCLVGWDTGGAAWDP